MCINNDAVEWLRRPAVPLKPQASHPIAANIVADCSIGTDSVVATATVRTNGTMRRIVVQWGDGTTNTLRNRPGLDAVVGHDQQLPPGTYKLSHAYQAPQDRKPFSHVVIIRVEDAAGGTDFCIQQITLTPRYRVTQYRIRLNLESQCDSPFETRAEFDIRLFVAQQLVNTWHWEPSQSIWPGDVIVLDGSIVSRELTLADGIVYVQLQITETDPVFDDHLSASMSLSASDVSASISNVTEGDGCKVRYSYHKDVTLIVPLPSYGLTVVAAVNP